MKREMQGLKALEVSERLAKWGPNEIRTDTQVPFWSIIISQFASPLILILLVAAALSAFLGEYLEAAAIGAIVLANAMIGFVQEYRAETAIAALRELTAPRTRVVRDGSISQILSRDVVPDDIVLLEAGDIVPADGELLEVVKLTVNEAALTGESVPVRKSIEASDNSRNSDSRVFMGTSVTNGTATMIVIGTGMRTELGKIAQLISHAQEEMTPLQRQMLKVGQSLLYASLLIVGLVALIGLMRGFSFLELLKFSTSLAVAVVPEGLPAIVTVALALGVQRMARKNALVRKLPSVETLGSVSVICTDKTGTLTTGVMQVRELWGADHLRLLRAAASCCDAELDSSGLQGTGDSSELAILMAARARGVEKLKIEVEDPREWTEPFDSATRKMVVGRKSGNVFTKGAFETLAPLCEPRSVEGAKQAVEEMAERGLRVLAVAIQEPKATEPVLLGLIGIADPPRTEVIEAIRQAKEAGITPVMITGDHPHTAAAIARELGLLTSDDQLNERVHARATPEEKLKLVRAWKAKGAVVAMTGDGVNDAPALREAHIGIAMGKTGTEVTRQAADMILADDNFATIIAAVKEGRSLFLNIRRALIYLLTGNFGEIVLILIAVILGLPLPLQPAHLLWINLVTDAFPALTLIAEEPAPDLMTRKPRPLNEKILGKAEWLHIASIGLLEASVMCALFYVTLSSQGVAQARSLTFSALVLSQLLRIFAARSSSRIFWQVGVLSNLWLLGLVLIGSVLQMSLHFIPFTQKVFGLHPLSISDLTFILPFSLVTVTVVELKKLSQGGSLRDISER